MLKWFGSSGNKCSDCGAVRDVLAKCERCGKQLCGLCLARRGGLTRESGVMRGGKYYPVCPYCGGVMKDTAFR